MDWFFNLEPWVQALLATMFTWIATAFGAAFVFLFKNVKPSVYSFMLGAAGGVMIAASFWSLLVPAVEATEGEGFLKALPAAIGLAIGALTLFGCDKLIPHLHIGSNNAEGKPTVLKRTILLVLSITLHNIPEGLAVGVAFGAAANGNVALATSALILALGMGLQNIPEGMAVSIPLYNEGMKKSKAFFYGQISGFVEPIFGIIGALLVYYVSPILPYALAFAAGAMIYVVCEELIPQAKESETNSNSSHFAIWGLFMGLIIMTILDVALS